MMALTAANKVMTLTDRAADRVKSIMAKADKDYVGVRVGVKSGGCAGFSYFMEYAEDRAPLDEVVEDKGVTIMIDAKAILYLLGTEMDWEESALDSRFVFNNPNETERCGCGESFSVGDMPDNPDDFFKALNKAQKDAEAKGL